MPVRRGEVYWFDFDATVGSEQRGHRPAVIVSNNVQNERAPIVIVAAITTSAPSRPFPFIVELPAGQPLQQRSFVLCHQLRTIAKQRLGSYAGVLTRPQILQLESALRISLDLE